MHSLHLFIEIWFTMAHLFNEQHDRGTAYRLAHGWSGGCLLALKMVDEKRLDWLAGVGRLLSFFFLSFCLLGGCAATCLCVSREMLDFFPFLLFLISGLRAELLGFCFSPDMCIYDCI